MPSRGRHQSSSKESRRMIDKIEAIDGVIGVIIGCSYGGKSLGKSGRSGDVKIQRIQPGGFKAVTQSSRGLQELFIRIENGFEESARDAIEQLK